MSVVQKQKRVSPFSSKLFSRLIAFTAAFLVFALLFGSMFQMFESISMQAMLRMNEEFSAQASTISDSMQSIINTLGIQMFYISSTAKLRKSTSLTQNERVFALRELWQYAMSGSMLHSIYVFNPKLDYVYTTDNDYMSASMDGFYDLDAVALYRQRSPENRMRLYHRTFRENAANGTAIWFTRSQPAEKPAKAPSCSTSTRIGFASICSTFRGRITSSSPLIHTWLLPNARS